MNPIEEVIDKLRALAGSIARWGGSESNEYGETADMLEAAIRPYRRVPGPPTEPGEYWVKLAGKDCVLALDIHQHQLDTGQIWFGDCWARVIDVARDIEWHARVMPPVGEVSNE